MHTRTTGAMHLMIQYTSVGNVKHLYKQSNEFSVVDEQQLLEWWELQNWIGVYSMEEIAEPPKFSFFQSIYF